MGLDQRRHALVGEQPADEAGDNRRRWFRQRRKRINVDARSGDERDLVAAYAERQDRGAVVGVLHQDEGARAAEQSAQHRLDRRTQQHGFWRARGEGIAEPRHGIEADDRQSERGQRSDNDWHQSHMVDKFGPHPPIQMTDLAHRRQQAQRIEAAATPAKRMQDESFALNRSRMAGNAGCDMDLKARA